MKRGTIRRAPLAVALACAATVLVLPLGAAAKPHKRAPETQITINRWDGETLAGTEYNTPAKGTITHCATDPGMTLHIHGSVKHTVADRHIVVQFLLEGKVRDAFREHWTSTGSGSFSDGIINHEGLPDGRWGLRVIQGKHTIGSSFVVIEADPSC